MTRQFPIAVVALLILALPLLAEEMDRTFEHSFDVQKGAILHLAHGDGDVDIEPWDEDRIDVRVRFRHDVKGWKIGGGEDSFDVRFRQVDEHVYVEEQRDSNMILVFGASINREYTYTIRAPHWVRLDIEGDDGDVEIANWRADVDLSSDDGDVRLMDCEDARFDLRLQDGDLTVSRCSGQFDVELSDGNVDFRRVTTQALQLLVEDGDVDLDLLAVGAVDWELELDDGDLTLEFPAGLDAELELETDEGRIRTSGFEEDGRRREHRLSARLGDGSGRILARSEDGDLSIRQLGGEP